MLRRIGLPGLLLTMTFALGCGGSDSVPKIKAIAVKGTVNLDGKPLAEGDVYFVLSGQAPTIMPIKDGAYAGTAYPGKNVVEVRAYKPGPPLSTDPTNAPTKSNYIPARFSDQSKLTADVAAGAANEFKFDVTSK